MCYAQTGYAPWNIRSLLKIPSWEGQKASAFGVCLSGSAAQPVGGTSPYTPFKGGLLPSSSTGATPTLRLGLKIVRGLRQSSALALMQEREVGPFRSVDDLAQRLPQLQKDELKI